jgi:TPR repeat protein
MFQIAALLGPRNPAQARRLLENAARAGNVDAKYNLAVLLRDSDPAEAARWENEWGSSGHETLHTFLGIIRMREAEEAAQEHRMSEQ